MSIPPRWLTLSVVLAARLLLVPPSASAADSRFWLASQQDFGGKRGLYLAFENSAASEQPCPLNTLKLILGVGDGKAWRFPSMTPVWKLNHEYTVVAKIGADKSQLRLDNLPPVDSPGAFTPATGAEALLSNHVPEWAAGEADYRIFQTSLRLERSGGKTLVQTFPGPTQFPEPLRLFDRRSPSHRQPLTLKPGETLILRATFKIVPAAASSADGTKEFAPLIDRYGQAIAAEWPGKVRTDADLKAPIAEENLKYKQWGAPPNQDRFGGDTKAGWHGTPTGVFRAVKHGKFWWLLSPAGNPCFYTGLCSAPALTWETTPVTGRESLFADLPPHTAPYDAAWGGNAWGGAGGPQESVALRTANLIRKYGPDWKAEATANLTQRLRAWGFSGLAKWCGDSAWSPTIPVLRLTGVPTRGRHVDVFDPGVQTQVRDVLRKQIAGHETDPLIVGWSIGNEYDEIITPDEIAQILQKDADCPAKRALIDEALRGASNKTALLAAWKHPGADADALSAVSLLGTPPDDLERLRRFYADRYYDFLYRTVKEIDPKHLYLGFWIVLNWWVSEEDWRLIARHCDIIGYDHYGFEFADSALQRLMAESDKPVLCGEFSFPPDYGDKRGFGVYSTWADDEAQAGQYYADWVKDAATNPYCVGVCWFQYRDEPLTGRGPGSGPNVVYGENYAFGLADECDRPKWPLVERVRQENLVANAQRLKAAAGLGAPMSSRSGPRRPKTAARPLSN